MPFVRRTARDFRRESDRDAARRLGTGARIVLLDVIVLNIKYLWLCLSATSYSEAGKNAGIRAKCYETLGHRKARKLDQFLVRVNAAEADWRAERNEQGSHIGSGEGALRPCEPGVA